MAASSIDAIQKNPKDQQLVAERSRWDLAVNRDDGDRPWHAPDTPGGDEERGHWLMSLLPNSPPLSLRCTFAPVRGNSMSQKASWLERLGFATQVFGLRLSVRVEAPRFAEEKNHVRKPSEGVTPALT